MKKTTLLFILLIGILFTSCADSKTFTDNKGQTFTAEPYGWANQSEQKYDTVIYDVCVGNVVWDVLLFETVVVPIWLTGWELYEPIRLKTKAEYERTH